MSERAEDISASETARAMAGGLVAVGGVRGRRRRRGVILIDAILGSILLGVALAAVVGLVGQSLRSQRQGQELREAAGLLDEILQMVLVRGPDNYERRFPLRGVFDPPFQRYSYELIFSEGVGGLAYKVTATVRWMSGLTERSETIQTLISPRRGEEPDPIRRPAQSTGRSP